MIEDETGRPAPPPIADASDYVPMVSSQWSENSNGAEIIRAAPAQAIAPTPLVPRPPIVSDTPPISVLAQTFGYNSFRPLQEDIINSVLACRDTLAVMPTGGGKSLCYQLPALLFDGLTVVISPLISLMQDQVRQLDALGIPAALLNSSLDRREYATYQRQVIQGEAKLLYVAPETLFQARTQALLRQVHVSCLTIDEAHCISEWGHDFRPEYRRIVELRQQFPYAVCVALTATATPRVRTDIASVLGMRESSCFIASFDRPNLQLEVKDRSRPIAQLMQFIEQADGKSGIVYCSTRKRVEEVTADLGKQGLNVRPYHAGLDEKIRRENQDAFIRDDVDIIVATVAFGMGINKPDIRWVVHHDIPKTIEGYYQEIGRAGRDGLPAHCLLLYSPGDLRTIEYFISQKSDSEQRIARIQLQQMVGYCESYICRRRPLLDYFGEVYANDTCGQCDNCHNPKVLQDITRDAQKFLSCVYRTGQRYGANYIADILRGSRAQKILQHGHHRLSTYGIGRDKDAKEWTFLARQLVQLQLLHQDMQYGTLQLTAQAGAVLRSERSVEGVLRPKSTEKARRVPKTSQFIGSNADEGLFQALRQTRKELADSKGVPPYVIFTDKTLIAMASEQPRSLDDMGKLHGVGRIKRIKYGPIFLEAIGEYLGTEVELAPQPKRANPMPHHRTKGPSARTAAIVAALMTGNSLTYTADDLGVSTSVVVKHLQTFLRSGGELDDETLRCATGLDDEDIDSALAAMEEHGSARLRHVYDALNERIEYDVLEIVRLLHDHG